MHAFLVRAELCTPTVPPPAQPAPVCQGGVRWWGTKWGRQWSGRL